MTPCTFPDIYGLLRHSFEGDREVWREGGDIQVADTVLVSYDYLGKALKCDVAVRRGAEQEGRGGAHKEGCSADFQPV